MWIPIEMQLCNFISHRETLYKFKYNQLTLIQGINLDDSDDTGDESNGSGKTSILEGSYFILTGDSFRGSSLGFKDIDLITNGENNSKNYIIFINNFLKKKIKIIRNIDKKRGVELLIYYIDIDKDFENEENEKFESINSGNKFIIEILGVEKEDLANYYIISKDRFNSFYNNSDNKKKETIARFSGSDIINGVDKLIEKDILLLNELEQRLNIDIEKTNNSINIYKEQLIECENENIEQYKQNKIEEIQNNINKINEDINLQKTKILNISTNIKEKNSNINILNQELINLNIKSFTVEFDKLSDEEKQINIIKEQLKKDTIDVNHSIKETDALLFEFDKIVKGSVECPNCNHVFNIADISLNIADIQNNIKDTTQLLNELELIKNDLNFKIQESTNNVLNIDKERVKLRQLNNIEQDKINNIKLKLSKQNNDITLLNKEIETINTNINRASFLIEQELDNIEKIKNYSNSDKINSFKDKINELNETLCKLSGDLENIKIDIQQKSIWIYHFAAFKSSLANEALTSIEGQVNFFLDKMKTDIQIKLSGFTLLADKKTIREKINCEVYKNSNLEGNINKLSKGERAKIELATIMAQQRLLNISSDSGGIDLLCIDEILDSLSSKGMNSIINSLKNTNSTIQLITHILLNNHQDNIVTITKKNKISYLLN